MDSNTAVVKAMEKLERLNLPILVRANIEDSLMKDLILPDLDLGERPIITAEFDVDLVSVQIGQRDWQWNKETGDMVHCGTFMTSAQEVQEPEGAGAF